MPLRLAVFGSLNGPSLFVYHAYFRKKWNLIKNTNCFV